MLLDDIKNGESDRLEFKETPNRESGKWLKTVVAFANCRGGRIVFGVKNSRKVVGLNGDLFAMKDGIADAVANACAPSIPVDICMSTVEGKSVIVLTMVQALAYMNIIEDWGSGIPRIRGDLKAAGLRDLELADWPNAVRAVIYRALPPNAGGKLAESGDRTAKIIELMSKNPHISVSAIVSAIGGGKRSIEREIAAMKAAGLIDRKGTFAGEWIVKKGDIA